MNEWRRKAALRQSSAPFSPTSTFLRPFSQAFPTVGPHAERNKRIIAEVVSEFRPV
jgi:hypothetical protein